MIIFFKDKIIYNKKDYQIKINRWKSSNEIFVKKKKSSNEI